MERLIGICVPISFFGIYLISQGAGELDWSSTESATKQSPANPPKDGWGSIGNGLLLQLPLALVFLGAWWFDRRETQAADQALADGRFGPLGQGGNETESKPQSPEKVIQLPRAIQQKIGSGRIVNEPMKYAQSIVEALLKTDLVAIRSKDDAIQFLAQVILNAAPDALVDEVIRFLDSNDVIDEIYTTDKELVDVIRGVLDRRDHAGTINSAMTEYWLQMSDGFAHEMWDGPFPSTAAAEARGWRCHEGIYVALIRRESGKPDEFVMCVGDPEDGLEN